MGKYKLTWKDLTWRDFKIYLFALFKAFVPKSKIKDLNALENFIQTKSAWVTQVTLYGYLKTRMGTRYVLHFENDEFMASVNLAKWNIYAMALQETQPELSQMLLDAIMQNTIYLAGGTTDIGTTEDASNLINAPKK